MEPTQALKEETTITKITKPISPTNTRRRGQGHIVPPSTATHPKDRWDMFYVYMFIKNFTNLIPDIPSFLTIAE
jgi:hypothetical protein